MDRTQVDWSIADAKYDLTYFNPWYNKRCRASSGDKDCCLCLRKRPCKDEGCYARGGMCVDIKNTHTMSFNFFPRHFVNLGERIPGDDLCKDTSATGGKKCCECFKRKERIDKE